MLNATSKFTGNPHEEGGSPTVYSYVIHVITYRDIHFTFLTKKKHYDIDFHSIALRKQVD